MASDRQKTYARIGLASGIVCILCGLLITVISVLDVSGHNILRLASGILFIGVGIIYIAVNSRKLK